MPNSAGDYLNDDGVKQFETVIRLIRMLLFAGMFAICMVMGIAPFIPKRKEQFAIEVKMEEAEKKEGTNENTTMFQADC